MLQIDRLSKTDNQTFKALDNVSFSAKHNSICGIVGPNGAGKTTTIRIILGILAADSGTITYDGIPISDIPRSTFGYLPEERGLYKKATSFETLMYLGSLKTKNTQQLKKDIDTWLERFTIPDYKHKKIDELSKGNQQKIQFIASVLHNPEILIVDEPLSGLDPINQELFKDIVKELSAHTTILFCSHQLAIAQELCDSVVILNKGRVALSDTMNAIIKPKSNLIRIEFDTPILRDTISLPHQILNDHELILELPQQASINDVMPILISMGTIQSIQHYTPSLLSVFKSIVGDHIEEAGS